VSPLSSSTNKLKAQIRNVTFLLVLLNAFTSFLLWQHIESMVTMRNQVIKNFSTLNSATEIEGSLNEEAKISLDFASGTRAAQLSLLHTEIEKQVTKLVDNVGENVELSSMAGSFEKSWKSTKAVDKTGPLLPQLRTLKAALLTDIGQKRRLMELATERCFQFLVLNVVLLAVTISLFNRFMGLKVFNPLQRLHEKMSHFGAGYFDTVPVSSTDTEIGQLQLQFNEMADRVSQTVKELQELDRLKSDFLAVASHELRTPMTSIKGSIGLILEGLTGGINEDTRSTLEVAEHETDRLIRIINDILDLTKIEAQRFVLHKEWTSIHSLAQVCLQTINGFAEKMGISVRIMGGLDEWNLNVDSDRIQQVVTNLLSNAVKFSPRGKSVIVSWGLNEFNVFTVKVQDQGPGISEEDQAIIFEKFKQTSVAYKNRELKGTGLGLPISKALVEQHGGHISVTSELGVGSTFYFTIPEAQLTSNHVAHPEVSAEQKRIAA